MKNYIYKIQWIIRINGGEREHKMYVEADNAREAREAFDDFCYIEGVGKKDPYNKKSHPFHITVKRTYEQIDALCICTGEKYAE